MKNQRSVKTGVETDLQSLSGWNGRGDLIETTDDSIWVWFSLNIRRNNSLILLHTAYQHHMARIIQIVQWRELVFLQKFGLAYTHFLTLFKILLPLEQVLVLQFWFEWMYGPSSFQPYCKMEIRPELWLYRLCTSQWNIWTHSSAVKMKYDQSCNLVTYAHTSL